MISQTMNNHLISVIIPVYNVEQYLDRCLRSVADNTYRELEIICVNDGSTDQCGAILQRFAREDARFRIITTPNGGLSAARNKGLAASTGEFVAFIDSDDWIHPAYFERMYRQLLEKECDIAICAHERTKEMEPYPVLLDSMPDSAVFTLDQIYQRRTLKNYVWGKLYRADNLPNAWFVEERTIVEDVLFNLDVFTGKPTLRACYLPEKLYYYFDRSDSLVYSIRFAHRIRTVELFIQKSEQKKDPHLKAIYLTEALKSLLSVRYWAGRKHETQTARKCGRMLRQTVRSFVKLPGVSVITKSRFSLLCYVPLIYSSIQWLDSRSSSKK